MLCRVTLPGSGASGGIHAAPAVDFGQREFREPNQMVASSDIMLLNIAVFQK
jgi:hypothetical protein